MIEGVLLILLGAAAIAGFAYLNLIWEPEARPVEAAPSGEGWFSPHSVHGMVECGLFLLGTTLAAAGFLIIGTLHPTA